MLNRFKPVLILMVLLVSLGTPLFAQDIVIDGQGKTEDDIVFELILGADQYHQQNIRLENFIYTAFGTRSNQVAFYKCDPWFRETETYGFKQSDAMYDYSFTFWFHPDTMEGRRFAMELNGNTYRAPMRVSMAGFYVKHPLGSKELNLFIVEELTIDGNTYTGTLPPRISQ